MREFLKAIRGTLNAHRRAWVSAAFAKLDRSRTGAIEERDMLQIYRDADVSEMMRGLGDKNGDGVITRAE
eukprot:4381760-Prymnesium_polylepis.1